MTEISEPPGSLYNPFCYHADDWALEKFLLTGMVVAGKVARVQQGKLDTFLGDLKRLYPNWPPLRGLSKERPDEIRLRLLMVRMGQYTRLTNGFHALSRAVYPIVGRPLDLRTCSAEALEAIPGIGMKTSRFFIMYSRPVTDVAVLDTHVLAYMREHHLADNVPKSTPTGRGTYLRLERAWLAHCREQNIHPGELDFAVRKERNKGDKFFLSKGAIAA